MAIKERHPKKITDKKDIDEIANRYSIKKAKSSKIFNCLTNEILKLFTISFLKSLFHNTPHSLLDNNAFI